MNQQQEEGFASVGQTWTREKPTPESMFDRAKKTAADKLHQAAQTLHDKSENLGNQVLGQEVEQYGHRTADWLNRTADYVGEANPQQIKADLEKQVQQNPGRTLLIAGGIGLLLGAMFRRR